ncbi:E3 ubiquitin-protein ligase SGR9 [Abeliophyllum distichum]|uniref:E3 ubiquitin-protein ligase SGR9 n=1 Tax=Abeliophyllum distichum TaxID=126358 RepID=A0ABD1SBA2_9LAMI
MADQNSTEAIIMAAISTLSPSRISDLSHSIAALFHCHRRRLFSLLSSPTIFSFTLQHLQTISLHKKSLLIAHYLLLNLSVLNHFLRNSTAVATLLRHSHETPGPRSNTKCRARLDICQMSSMLFPSQWCLIHVFAIEYKLMFASVNNGRTLPFYLLVVSVKKHEFAILFTGCGCKEVS